MAKDLESITEDLSFSEIIDEALEEIKEAEKHLKEAEQILNSLQKGASG